MKSASKLSLTLAVALSFSGCAFATDSVQKAEITPEATRISVEPVKVEPVTVKTEPVSVKVEPVMVKTEPVNVKVEPVMVKTEPVGVKVETVKVETIKFEPLKVELVKPPKPEPKKEVQLMTLTVVGMGVYPETSISQAQSVAMAKRAAIMDGYRLLTEKVYGVHIDGIDFVRNMVTKRSDLRATVQGLLKYANVVESVCRDGACQVEMELKVNPEKLKDELSSL